MKKIYLKDDQLPKDPNGKMIFSRDSSGRRRVATFNSEPTRTHQEFGEESDVNIIMAKYRQTRQLPLRQDQGVYADLTSLPVDLQTAIHVMQKAESSFNELPSEVRKRFDNDPNALINFLNNRDNDAEAIKLGLRAAPPQEDPQLTALKSIDENLKKPRKSEKKADD